MEFIIIAYTQLLSIKHISITYITSANYTQLSMGPVYLVHNLLFASNQPVIITISVDYNKKLLNLVKIYIDNAKYSDCNDSFTSKLSTFHDTYSKADVPLKIKIMVFLTIFKGLALDYYDSNISISIIAMNFD